MSTEVMLIRWNFADPRQLPPRLTQQRRGCRASPASGAGRPFGIPASRALSRRSPGPLALARSAPGSPDSRLKEKRRSRGLGRKQRRRTGSAEARVQRCAGCHPWLPCRRHRSAVPARRSSRNAVEESPEKRWPALEASKLGPATHLPALLKPMGAENGGRLGRAEGGRGDVALHAAMRSRGLGHGVGHSANNAQPSGGTALPLPTPTRQGRRPGSGRRDGASELGRQERGLESRVQGPKDLQRGSEQNPEEQASGTGQAFWPRCRVARSWAPSGDCGPRLDTMLSSGPRCQLVRLGRPARVAAPLEHRRAIATDGPKPHQTERHPRADLEDAATSAL